MSPGRPDVYGVETTSVVGGKDDEHFAAGEVIHKIDVTHQNWSECHLIVEVFTDSDDILINKQKHWQQKFTLGDRRESGRRTRHLRPKLTLAVPADGEEQTLTVVVKMLMCPALDTEYTQIDRFDHVLWIE